MRVGSLDQANVKPNQIDKYLLNKFNKRFDKARDKLRAMSPKKDEAANQKFAVKSPARDNGRKSESRGRKSIRAINDSSPSHLFNKNGTRDHIFNPKGESLQKGQVKDLLIHLDLILERSNAKPNAEDDELFAELWRHLRPMPSRTSDPLNSEVVYIENLRVMLQVILKLIDPKRVCDPEESSVIEWKANPLGHSNLTDPLQTTGTSRMEPHQYGYVDRDGLLYIRPKELQYFQQRFEQFRINSFSYNKDQSKQSRNDSMDAALFNPQISKKSIQLGQERKRKIAREIGIDE